MTLCTSCNFGRHDIKAHARPVPCPTCDGSGTVETADFCANGHPLDVVGTYARSDGGRRCRRCQREYVRRSASRPHAPSGQPGQVPDPSPRREAKAGAGAARNPVPAP